MSIFKFVTLILKNLGRNKVRTVLTALAVVMLVAVATAVSAVTQSVKETVNSQSSQSRLFVAEKWVVPSRLPLRYLPEITDRRGVRDWTAWRYYGGYFDESRRNDRAGVGIATRIDNLLTMHQGLEDVDPGAIEALKRDKTGILVGRSILDQMNWKIGNRFRFVSTTHPGKDLQFKIVGVMPYGVWSRTFFFRDDYFEEATGDKENVNLIILATAGAEQADELAVELRREFGYRQPELKVETESAGVARIASRSQAILSVIDIVVVVLMVDMVIVLSNSISIATRERRAEMAILKVVGFVPLQIFLLVICEAMLIGAISGVVGASLAWGLSEVAGRGYFPASELTTLVLAFPVKSGTVPFGALLGALVGLLGSVMPAWQARNVRITEVFSKIA